VAAALILGATLLLVAFICAIGWLSAFNGTDPGSVCVVQQGGPFDGRGIKSIRQGGEGVSNIGIWNHQRCFPATQRNYIVSQNPAESDSKSADVVQVPTLDAVNVFVEGQALFRLNTDPAVVRDFYKKYGVRTFDGKHLYDGDQGWNNFLAIQFRPVLENALREAIGQFNCTELNNTCQYVTNASEAVKGNVKTVANGQNLTQAQTKIEETLQRDLNSTLGGNYFQNIRFRLRGVTFENSVKEQISQAQTKRTEVATAQLEANRQVQEAIGKTRVAKQQAEQIRIKSQAYKANKVQGEIDLARAICGDQGCQNLQVLGSGGVTKLLSSK
jgi:regulator of protease activity HflC (stomatin/prohibitin superfamily)